MFLSCELFASNASLNVARSSLKNTKIHEMLRFSQCRGSFPFEFALRSWSHGNGGKKRKTVGGSAADTFSHPGGKKTFDFCNFPPSSTKKWAQLKSGRTIFLGGEAFLKTLRMFLENSGMFSKSQIISLKAKDAGSSYLKPSHLRKIAWIGGVVKV